MQVMGLLLRFKTVVVRGVSAKTRDKTGHAKGEDVRCEMRERARLLTRLFIY